MKIVSEVGSREYYELRAIEEIHAARICRTITDTDLTAEHLAKMYQQHINKALQLLALAALTA